MAKTPLFMVLAAAAATLAASASPLAARAADGCDLTVQAKELAAVQGNTSMDEAEQLNAEILARRKLMTAAIDCDQKDVAARVEALGHMPEAIKAVPAYGKILDALAEASHYYDVKKEAIQHLGVWDLKTTARGMAAWRQKIYITSITWADNFLLWADNQQFLERASARLSQVSGVAFSLKLVNQDEINDLFNKAKSSFDTAFDENDQAKSALNEKRPLAALVHTQASLKALSATYDIFFALQTALEKIVK